MWRRKVVIMTIEVITEEKGGRKRYLKEDGR